jgi:recombination protein RecT
MPNAVDTARIREQMEGASHDGQNAKSDGATSTASQPSGWLAGVVDPIRPLVARALPENLNAERFVEAIFTELRSLPEESGIRDCPEAEIRRGIMRLALLGLEPGPAEHVVLYPTWSGRKKTTELVPRATYKGIVELARRSGRVRTIRANAVHADEEFRHFFDDEGEHLFHEPVLDPKSELVAYYAVAYGTDGKLLAAVVLSPSEIERRRSYSKRAETGAWREHHDAMARKTAILALGPFLPLTPQQVEVLEGGTSADPSPGINSQHSPSTSSPPSRTGAPGSAAASDEPTGDSGSPEEDDPRTASAVPDSLPQPSSETHRR